MDLSELLQVVTHDYQDELDELRTALSSLERSPHVVMILDRLIGKIRDLGTSSTAAAMIPPPPSASTSASVRSITGTSGSAARTDGLFFPSEEHDTEPLKMDIKMLQCLSWDKMHLGHWKDVSVVWRDIYALACLCSASTILQSDGPTLTHSHSGDGEDLLLTRVTKELDLGIMMGGPAFKDALHHAVKLAEQRLGVIDRAAPPTTTGITTATTSATTTGNTTATTTVITTGNTMASATMHAVGSTGSGIGLPQLDPQTRLQSDPTHRPPKRRRDEDQCVIVTPSGDYTQPALDVKGGHISTGQGCPCSSQTPVLTALQLPPSSLDQGDALRTAVPSLDLPSLERFAVECMGAKPAGQPTVITGAMQGWPALTRWNDLQYLRRAAGHRTVPVEVGSHYLADGWGQNLMTLSDFIDKHILHHTSTTHTTHTTQTTHTTASADMDAAHTDAPAPVAMTAHDTHDTSAHAPCPSPSSPSSPPPSAAAAAAGPTPIVQAPSHEISPPVHIHITTATATTATPTPTPAPTPTVPSTAASPAPVGYLAQHPLFEQIPALAADVLTPEYCVLGKDEEEGGGVQSVNAWFGPPGTLTPLHTDPHHNLLCQVIGSKYIRLYAPSQTPAMYPYEQGLTTNSSQVDIMAPDQDTYPLFITAPYLDCVLKPGEMLYIPPGWWHFVMSLEVSFSVSYWWC